MKKALQGLTSVDEDLKDVPTVELSLPQPESLETPKLESLEPPKPDAPKHRCLEFHLVVKATPVRLIRKDGVKVMCAILELTGEQRDEYLNEVKKRTEIRADGKAAIKDFKGMHASLLKRALVRVKFANDDDPDVETMTILPNGAFTEEQIQKDIPSSTQSALFEEAQRLSALGEKGGDDDEDEAKND